MLGTVPGSGDSVRNTRHTPCLHELVLQVGKQRGWREETQLSNRQLIAALVSAMKEKGSLCRGLKIWSREPKKCL